VPAQPASTVLALRPSRSGFDVLMVRRAVGSEFMGNAYVFPGGSIEDRDRTHEAAAALCWDGDPEEIPWRAAALRELHEETGLALADPPDLAIPADADDLYTAVMAAGGRLDAVRLHYVSRWITPEGLPRRFDTRFYVTGVPEAAQTVADQVEVFDDTWVDPAEALRNGDRGDWEVPFPTRKHLEILIEHDSVGSVLRWAASITEVPGVLPRIVLDDNGGYTVRLPGEPGYDTEVDR
jgi:8-oxo-dGTP pyrophosphatase MutT (NUDIX family)